MKKQNKGNKNNGIVEPRINDELRGNYDVRAIYGDPNDGGFNKVMPLGEAKKAAERLGLDIVEINAKASPPIMRIVNYSKYLYELKKNLKNKKRNSVETKEIQLTVNISDHDLEVKAKKAAEFIKNGDKVRVVLRMRGRELTRREASKMSLFQFVNLLSDVAIVENLPKDEGNKCIVYLKKKK